MDVRDVIIAPRITEKSMAEALNNQYTFTVNPHATKTQIRHAIEDIFKVNVVKVNTINVKGKTKRFRGRVGQRSDVKKAIVTLAEGQSIDITTGL